MGRIGLGALAWIYATLISSCGGKAPSAASPQADARPPIHLWTAQYVQEGVPLTWQKARVYLPYNASPTTLDRIPRNARLGVVLFMHGCWGFETEEHVHWARLLTAQGLLVIMPDSFARPNRQRRCDLIDDHGGSDPAVHDMRLAEIAYAKAQIEKQPWFDGKNLFLMGYSEGAIAAVRTPLHGFSGVIATSWTCTHRGYPPLNGIFLPLDTPLLTLSYDDDPWFPLDHIKGNCGQQMAGRRDATHMTVPSQGELHRMMHQVDKRVINLFRTQGHNHGTFNSQMARRAVIDFIARHRRPP